MRKKNLLITLVLIFTVGTLLIGCTNNNTSSTNDNQPETSSTNDNQSEIEDNDSKNSESVSLKLGHGLTTEDHYHAFATKLQELVSEKSNGSINIDIFPQGQLGNEETMLEAAQSGTIDIVLTGKGPVSNRVKELGIFDLPYLFDSADQMNEILAGDIGDKYLDMLSDHDLVGLGFMASTVKNVFSNKPINDLSDIEGLKIRLSSALGYSKTYEALEALVTPMPFNEVYISLQQGVVDAARAAPDAYINNKFVEVTDYYNLTEEHFIPSVAFASQKTWNKLTSDQQNIIMESVQEAVPASIDHIKNSNDAALKKAEEEGTQIIETDVTEIKEKAVEAYDEILKEIPNGEKLLEEIQNEISK